jgi:hypothetical protein
MTRLAVIVLLFTSVVHAAPAAAPLVSSHPQFAAWFARHQSDPRAQAAKRLADRLTWAQLALIERPVHLYRRSLLSKPENLGVQFFELQRGCPHACKGCFLLGGKQRPIQTMKFSTFTSAVDSLVGLEGALNDMMRTMGRKKEFHLIHVPNRATCADPVAFYASDPMQYWDGSSGKGIHDAISYFHSATGRAMTIVTSGWSPAGAQQQQAERLLGDIKAGRGSVGSFLFQIKPVSDVFLAEARKQVTELLRTDEPFQRQFGSDLAAHGLDFDKYASPGEAKTLYASIVKANAAAIVTGSSYMKARLANLRTVMTATGPDDKVIQLRVYGADETRKSLWDGQKYNYTPLVEPWIAPLVGSHMASTIREVARQSLPEDQRASLKFASEHQSEWKFEVELRGISAWRKSYNLARAKFLPVKGGRLNRIYRTPEGPVRRTVNPGQREWFYHYGMPIVTPDGAIKFSGSGEGAVSPEVPGMARSHDRNMRALAHEPLFWPDNNLPARWKLAGQRMTGAQIADMQLSEAERKSALVQIRSQLGALGRSEADLIKINEVGRMAGVGGTLAPCVFVQLRGSAPVLFNLRDGTLHERDGRALAKLAPR